VVGGSQRQPGRKGRGKMLACIEWGRESWGRGSEVGRGRVPLTWRGANTTWEKHEESHRASYTQCCWGLPLGLGNRGGQTGLKGKNCPHSKNSTSG